MRFKLLDLVRNDIWREGLYVICLVHWVKIQLHLMFKYYNLNDILDIFHSLGK